MRKTNAINGAKPVTLGKPLGIVKEFDPNTMFGVVTLERSDLSFHSTSFSSNSTTRFPRAGEQVEVVLASSGSLLSLRGA